MHYWLLVTRYLPIFQPSHLLIYSPAVSCKSPSITRHTGNLRFFSVLFSKACKRFNEGFVERRARLWFHAFTIHAFPCPRAETVKSTRLGERRKRTIRTTRMSESVSDGSRVYEGNRVYDVISKQNNRRVIVRVGLGLG